MPSSSSSSSSSSNNKKAEASSSSSSSSYSWPWPWEMRVEAKSKNFNFKLKAASAAAGISKMMLFSVDLKIRGGGSVPNRNHYFTLKSGVPFLRKLKSLLKPKFLRKMLKMFRTPHKNKNNNKNNQSIATNQHYPLVHPSRIKYDFQWGLCVFWMLFGFLSVFISRECKKRIITLYKYLLLTVFPCLALAPTFKNPFTARTIMVTSSIVVILIICCCCTKSGFCQHWKKNLCFRSCLELLELGRATFGLVI